MAGRPTNARREAQRLLGHLDTLRAETNATLLRLALLCDDRQANEVVTAGLRQRDGLDGTTITKNQEES
jgi:hypothetical protein